MITINKEEDLIEVKNRIEQVLGMKEDPIDKFHSTIRYYDNNWLYHSRDLEHQVTEGRVSLGS